MKLALDSNRYTDLCRGDAALRDLLEQVEQVSMPFVVIAELRAAFAAGRRTAENEAVLGRFLLKPRVAVLHSTDATTRCYANLYRQLRQQGTPIPTNDLWIAALVVEHSLVLCSRDDHFLHLPQLQRV